MRICKPYNFDGIRGYKLGWAPVGPPLMTVYCYLMGDLMIDSGLAHMRTAALEIARYHHIQRVFLTHHHEDHSGNAAALKQDCDARVFGNPRTAAKLATRFPILPYQKYVWGTAAPLGVADFPEAIETPLGAMIPVHTPGHSQDHTVFLLKESGVLFSGDLYLADTIKYFRADEDIGSQIDSLRKVLNLDFDTLLCSHFPRRTGGKERIGKKLVFLEDLYGAVVDLWQKGMPEKRILRELKLKEAYFTKAFCFGNVSMLNGVKSVVRHYETVTKTPTDK